MLLQWNLLKSWRNVDFSVFGLGLYQEGSWKKRDGMLEQRCALGQGTPLRWGWVQGLQQWGAMSIPRLEEVGKSHVTRGGEMWSHGRAPGMLAFVDVCSQDQSGHVGGHGC